MATEDDKVNTGALATLVAVGVFATVAVALGVDALVRFESAKMQADRAGQAETQVHDLVREQRAQLDAQPLPIDRAMAAVLLDLRQNPWSATPPPPERDAGADAAVEATDAGVDAAVETEDGGAPAPAVPEGGAAPSAAPAPVPSAPTPAAPAPAAPTTVAPKAPAPTVPVTAPTAAKPPALAPTTAVAPKPATPPAAPAAPAPAPAAPAPKPTDG